MTKKIVIVSLILNLALFTTGCWDRTEVGKLAIVIGLGIDKISDSDQILLTAQIVNPSAMKKEGGGGQEQAFFIATSQGKTIYDAIRNFSKSSPHRMFYSHNSVIMIGEQMAKSSIKPIMDYFERDPQFRRNTLILVTPNTAREILEGEFDLERLSALGMEDVISEFSKSPGKLVQRKDFTNALLSRSHSAIAPKMELIDQEAEVIKKLKELSYGEERIEIGKMKKKTKQIRLTGMAIFNNGKLAGYLNDAESRGLLWIIGALKGGAVIARCPEEDEKNFVFEIQEVKTKLFPSFKGEQLKMHVEIESESTIAEVNCSKLDISKPETIKKLEKLNSEAIEKRIMETINKTQELKSDVLLFSESFFHKHPQKWTKLEKNWGEHFSNIEVTVKVTSKIKRVGMSSKPLDVGDQ